MNIQPDNQDTEPERYILWQFWLADHDGPVLFNQYIDGTFEEADIMLPSQIVDLQTWDPESGQILNHLFDQGWQPGLTPYGIDPDAPLPIIGPDHETLPEPAREPPVQKTTPDPAPAPRTPIEPPQVPKAPLEPSPQAAAQTTAVRPASVTVCILPNRTATKRSSSSGPRTEYRSGLCWALCGWLFLLVLISRWSSSSASSPAAIATSYAPVSNATNAPAPGAAPPASQSPIVRRALPVLTSEGKLVRRALPVMTLDGDGTVIRPALPVVVRRATLVQLPKSNS